MTALKLIFKINASFSIDLCIFYISRKVNTGAFCACNKILTTIVPNKIYFPGQIYQFKLNSLKANLNNTINFV